MRAPVLALPTSLPATIESLIAKLHWKEIAPESDLTEFGCKVHRCSAKSTKSCTIEEPKTATVHSHGPVYRTLFVAEEMRNFGNAMFVLAQREERRRIEEAERLEDSSGTQKYQRFEDLYEDQESPDLLRLDPAKWMDQDHYAVLGLRNMRWRATDEDIKKACTANSCKYSVFF
jgi:hypothetical protein